MTTSAIITKANHEKTQTKAFQECLTSPQNRLASRTCPEGCRSLQGVGRKRRGRQAHHRRRASTDACPGVQNQVTHPASRARLKRRAARNKLLPPAPATDRTYFTWLRQRTAQYHFALKQPCWDHEKSEFKIDGQGNYILEPRPVHTNAQILSVLAQRKGFLRKMRNADYQDHIAGTDTYYFQGEGRPDRPETLVMIDIDVRKSRKLGSTKGALAFVHHLRKTFPDLRWELSTNGKGIHAYLVLHKLGVSARDVNAVQRTFEKWLKQEARRAGVDIEDVEVKGGCPVFEYEDGKLVKVKAGTNAKLPRGDVRATTHIDITDLAKFQPVEEKVPVVRRSSHGSSSASWCPKAITPDDLADMPRLRKVARLLGLPSEKCSGRVAVTVEDVAIFLLLLGYFTRNMNENGTLPWARYERFWTTLYQAGDVERAFNPKRFAAIRNHLSSLVVDGECLLEWEDETYCMGRACKWRASEKLMQMMEEEREEASSTETTLTVLDDYPRPRLSWQAQKDENERMRKLMSEVARLFEEKRRLAA